MDLIYLAGIILFAALTLFIIKGCSRLGGEQ
jgi:hypothetical protein